jgi:hypothetical protein
MVLQFGKAGINCSVDLTYEEFVNQLGSTLALDRLDSKECYKKYRKEYDKLNPKEVFKKDKKKSKKEA